MTLVQESAFRGADGKTRGFALRRVDDAPAAFICLECRGECAPARAAAEAHACGNAGAATAVKGSQATAAMPAADAGDDSSTPAAGAGVKQTPTAKGGKRR
ncbi:hypothetical protein [Longimicrobium sp.]|uniref:hypothetical protein n=1 Tax=Longimicrobium sp. TaxID=2029185 RepID=UPI002E2F4C4E|nr:hypothetical protein [Longimicrobium sp.]HEX6038042.1 hypothetical protein [Longimicrobium sp.]